MSGLLFLPERTCCFPLLLSNPPALRARAAHAEANHARTEQHADAHEDGHALDAATREAARRLQKDLCMRARRMR